MTAGGAEPLVRAVVVTRNGGEPLRTCLAALAATDWPALEIVVVDNGSTDGSPEEIASAFPRAEVRRLGRNAGFAAGCNAALRDLGAARYAALVNDDARVEPGWLRPLVERLERDPGLGAACPKILLEGEFAELELRAPVHVRGRGDPRPLGVRVHDVRVDGHAGVRAYFADGFHGPEREAGRSFQWSAGRARMLVELPAKGSLVELLVSCDPQKDVAVRSGQEERTLRAGLVPAWQPAPAEPLGVPVLNSVGAAVLPGGLGGDRGFLEPDRGQYDVPSEVAAWSGAAVLLRRAYLEDVGLFDERLFVYYEDFDLSWRGRTRGWRYAAVPASVVHHLHASSARTGSPLFDHFNERNRLLVAAKNASASEAAAAVADSLYTTALHLKRDVVARALAGERPDLTFTVRRLRATAAFAAALPHALSERRRARRLAAGNGGRR